jgi:hypothetical protein
LGETSKNEPKKLKTGEDSVPMNIDKSESSPTEADFKLLTDERLKELDDNQIISLINQLKSELNRRRKNEQGSSSYQISNHELENAITRAENALKTNNNDKGSSVGLVMGIVGIVSAFAIGSVVFLKRKLGKSNRK